MKRSFFFTLLAVDIVCVLAAEYTCCFRPDGWQREDWLQVKTPRWTELGEWKQCTDYIENCIPEGLSAEQLVSCHEAYVSMVWKEPLEGNALIAATMSFEDRYAPSIVLAGELGANPAFPDLAEYREHWEVVLYADGINIWHHEYRDGKPYWRLAAWFKHSFSPMVKYKLEVRITFAPKVPQLAVSCDGQSFGCMLPTFPRLYRVGITACEGRNRFYDFHVK